MLKKLLTEWRLHSIRGFTSQTIEVVDAGVQLRSPPMTSFFVVSQWPCNLVDAVSRSNVAYSLCDKM